MQWQHRLLKGVRIGKYKGVSMAQIARLIGFNFTEEQAAEIADTLLRADEANKLDVNDLDNMEGRFAELNDLDVKQSVLDRTLVRVRDQKNIVRRYNMDQARVEEVNYLVAQQIQANERKPLTAFRSPTAIGTTDFEAVLLWSDWHYGQVSDLRKEKFNETIADQRIQYLVEEAANMIVKDKIRKAHIFCLGDMIGGLLHWGNRVDSTHCAAEQMVLVAYQIAAGLRHVASVTSEVHVYLIKGNHDRLIANKKEASEKDTLQPVLVAILKTKLADVTNITFHEPEDEMGYIETVIAGKKIFAHHGHYARTNKAVTLLPKVQDWCMNGFPDYVLFGHFHHISEESHNNTFYIGNGGLARTDEFAALYGLSSEPVQRYFSLSPTKGRGAIYNIGVGHIQ